MLGERENEQAWLGSNNLTRRGDARRYARVSSTGQDLGVQLDKLKGCDKLFKEKRSGVDAGRPELSGA
jgi:hypothetical protein